MTKDTITKEWILAALIEETNKWGDRFKSSEAAKVGHLHGMLAGAAGALDILETLDGDLSPSKFKEVICEATKEIGLKVKRYHNK